MNVERTADSIAGKNEGNGTQSGGDIAFGQTMVSSAGDKASRAPEVTFFSNFLPYPIDHGGAMATHGLIQALASSASVSVLVLTSVAYSDAVIRAAEQYYSKSCRSFTCHRFENLSPGRSLFKKAWDYLRGYPRHGLWSREAAQVLGDHIGKTGCDVLWCDSVFNAKYLSRVKRTNCRVVVTTQNVESDIVRQQLKTQSAKSWRRTWLRWSDLRRLERLAARSSDVVTAITDADLTYYRRVKGEDGAFLLGFGYVVPEQRMEANREEQGTICFVGSMDWGPNIQAAHFLVGEIMPLIWKVMPDTKCYIVGKNPAEEIRRLGSDKVIVTGSVPSVQEYYQRAQVIAVPVQEGSGIKIKLVEAMAAGKAVVSTSAGAAGLNVEHEKHLAIADRPEAFAGEMIRLLQDSSARQRMGAAARNFVAERMSPAETRSQVRKILDYLGLINPRRDPVPVSRIEPAGELV